MCLRDSPLVVGVVAHLAVNLGGDDDLVAAGEIAQRTAGDLLADAQRVDVGGVEEVDAQVKRSLG